MCRFKEPPASIVFLLVPPSESRSPPALITVHIECASHHSSSLELLIFSSILRAHGSISRGENDASLPAKLPIGTEFCTSHRRKLTFARLTAIISQNSRTVYYRINIYYRLIKIARCDCHHHKYTIGRKTKIKKNILMSTRMMSGMTYCHPLQLFELDTEDFFLSSYTTILHIIFLLYMYICRGKSPIMR